MQMFKPTAHAQQLLAGVNIAIIVLVLMLKDTSLAQRGVLLLR